MSGVSIRTVAEAAGVSVNTVSLALRDSGRVRAETRDRVLAEARRLGYRPNLLARAVVTGRSGMLGLLVRGLDDASYTARVADAALEASERHGYALVVMNHRNAAARTAECVEFLLERQADGFVVYAPTPAVPDATWDALRRSGRPAAFLSFGHADLPGDVIDLEPAAAGEMAVRRLAAAGRRRLAYAGPAGDFFSERRWEGVRAAARALGLAAPAAWDVSHDLAGGREAARRYLALRRRPDGVVGFADPVAAGFVHGVVAAGVAVPSEVAVTGVDDLPIAAVAPVPVTTLRAPAEQQARLAVDLLAARLRSGPAGGPPVRVTLDWHWVERDSVAPPP